MFGNSPEFTPNNTPPQVVAVCEILTKKLGHGMRLLSIPSAVNHPDGRPMYLTHSLELSNPQSAMDRVTALHRWSSCFVVRLQQFLLSHSEEAAARVISTYFEQAESQRMLEIWKRATPMPESERQQQLVPSYLRRDDLFDIRYTDEVNTEVTFDDNPSLMPKKEWWQIGGEPPPPESGEKEGWEGGFGPPPPFDPEE